MKKIKIPSNLTHLAYESIKQYILDGRLNEDSRLTEESLANQLGISKSPVREALNRLETEGLIRIEPRRGAYLRGFEIKDIEELYDLREALETHVVHKTAIDAALLGELRESIRRMREYLKDNDKRRYIDEDIHFHRTLAEASGNERLSKMLENVQQQIWLFRRKTYDLSSSSAPDAHEAILTALENGKRVQAERAMSEHIAGVRQKLVDFLAQESARRKATSNGK